MSEWLYACAAKDIQRYILDGYKLKYMVGGSSLVEGLCTSFLNEAIRGLRVENVRSLVQAAGWARLIIPDRDEAHRLAAVWPMLVSRYAPGLQMVQALVEINNGLPKAIACAEQMLRAERNVQEVPLSQATPLMERCPRTGNAAVSRDNELLVHHTANRKYDPGNTV